MTNSEKLALFHWDCKSVHSVTPYFGRKIFKCELKCEGFQHVHKLFNSFLKNIFGNVSQDENCKDQTFFFSFSLLESQNSLKTPYEDWMKRRFIWKVRFLIFHPDFQPLKISDSIRKMSQWVKDHNIF